jgi:polyhydroxyalkanoate synthesis regulator phasin
MIYRRKKLTQSLAIAALAATILAAAAPAFAQTTTGQSHVGFFQGLIQFIEQKFGLDQNQVQSAVQQYQAQRKATITPRPTLTQQQMSDNEKSRLDKLVSSGKITSDQESAILTELSSEQSKYNLSSLQSETPQQRKSTMQSMQNDLKTWAQQNNINPMYVMLFGGGMRGGRGMMKGGHGNWGSFWN